VYIDGLRNNLSPLSAAKGLTPRDAAWQHSYITNHREFFPRQMTTTFIHLPTQRLFAPASCFAQGTTRMADKVWPLSGRTTE
jgi:hypothetical protein